MITKFNNYLVESIDEFVNKMISQDDYDEALSKLTDNYGSNDIAKERLDLYLEEIGNLQVNGGKLYRLVFLKQINHLRKKDLGDHWTIYKDDISRFYHNIYVEDEGMKPYLITANFEPNSIDVNMSILNFSDLPDEYEVNITKQPINYKIKLYKKPSF